MNCDVPYANRPKDAKRYDAQELRKDHLVSCAVVSGGIRKGSVNEITRTIKRRTGDFEGA